MDLFTQGHNIMSEESFPFLKTSDRINYGALFTSQLDMCLGVYINRVTYYFCFQLR